MGQRPLTVRRFERFDRYEIVLEANANLGALGRLPARVTIYTVEALQAEPGVPLSEAVVEGATVS